MGDSRQTLNDPYLVAVRALFWLVFFGAFAFAAVQIWPVVVGLLRLLTPFILGLILAYIFHPIVVLVQDRLKLGRIAGIATVFACVFLILAIFFAILVPILYSQIRTLLDSMVSKASMENLDKMLARFVEDADQRQELINSIDEGIASLRQRIVEAFRTQPEMLKPVATESAGVIGDALRGVLRIFGKIGGVFATIVLSAVVAFYCLIEMSKIPPIMRRLLPVDQRERIWGLLLKSNQAVGGFLRGQLIACVGVGLLATVMLFLIGLKQYAVLIGFIAGAINFIPYLGPVCGATPAILWAIFTPELDGMSARLIHVGLVIACFAIIQMVDGFVFQPFIVGKQASLHPLAVMLALVVGAQFGLGGMILAVPVACVAKVFLIEFVWSRFPEETKAAPT